MDLGVQRNVQFFIYFGKHVYPHGEQIFVLSQVPTWGQVMKQELWHKSACYIFVTQEQKTEHAL